MVHTYVWTSPWTASPILTWLPSSRMVQIWLLDSAVSGHSSKQPPDPVTTLAQPRGVRACRPLSWSPGSRWLPCAQRPQTQQVRQRGSRALYQKKMETETDLQTSKANLWRSTEKCGGRDKSGAWDEHSGPYYKTDNPQDLLYSAGNSTQYSVTTTWEKNLKRDAYMYMCNWTTLLYTWN